MTTDKLTRNQKVSIGLLSTGTFLEYFDLMLYVHMAVLLNELFFPKYDPHTTSLISAFAFCITFVFRPVGALLFGWIGDNIGRRVTIIITTFLMGISCFIIANLPTYAQIGISATWIMLICRAIQGVSSMGEAVGAVIYLRETIHQRPTQYATVFSIEVFCGLGSACALGFATLITSYGLDWRLAFWLGTLVAVIGGIARGKLPETPDFVNFKKNAEKYLNQRNFTKKEKKEIMDDPLLNKDLNPKALISYFFIDLALPLFFFITYIYCGNILKDSFGYSSNQIIQHNFIISLVLLFNYCMLTYLNYKIYPLLLAKVRLIIFILFIMFLPYLLANLSSPRELMLIQSFIVFFIPTSACGGAIFFSYIPLAKRFTYIANIFAWARASMYIITSFGLIYLVDYFGNNGIFIIILPVLISSYLGLEYFIKLEKKCGNYPKGWLNIPSEQENTICNGASGK